MRTIKGLLTKASTKLPFSHIRVWVDPDNNKAPILDLNGENIILKNSAVKQQIIDVISRENEGFHQSDQYFRRDAQARC